MEHNPFRDTNFDYMNSRESTRDTFLGLSNHFKNNRWLGGNNVYRIGCVEKIKDDEKNNIPYNQRHLSQYIASSIPLHCMDGWSYLGKSIYSALMGDSHTSRHLAYYAQLRAVMSLFSSQGIGIFNKTHFYINNVNSIHRINHQNTNVFIRPTHDAVNEIFDNWINNDMSVSMLGKIIKPEGIKLSDWFDYLFVGDPFGFIGQNFIKYLGYDLDNFKLDREARNEASYRPTQINVSKATSIDTTLSLITEIWEDLCPVVFGNRLDLHLLKYSIHKYSSSTGRGEYLTEKKIIRTLEGIGIDDARVGILKDYLKRANNSKCLIIEQANKRTECYKDENYHLKMISRAVILLHLASASTGLLMKETSTQKSDIEFWWKDFGVNRGLWDSSQLDPLDYMFDEIEEALIEMNSGTFTESFDLRNRRSLEIITLSMCELIGLKNICL